MLPVFFLILARGSRKDSAQTGEPPDRSLLPQSEGERLLPRSYRSDNEILSAPPEEWNGPHWVG